MFGRIPASALCLATALLVGVPGASGTAQADPLGVIGGEQLDVSAERLDVDVRSGKALLEGNVHATLGDLTLDCPRVEIFYDESPRVKRAEGSGGVTARYKGIVAQAAHIDVDVPSSTVRMSGGVRLERGKGWVTAERAVLDVSTGKVSLETVKGAIPVHVPD